jgi:hypothetical protein
LRIALVPVLALGAAVVAAAPASAAPKLVVTPSTGLTDGQTVTLDVTGFNTTGNIVGASECATGPVLLSSCDVADTLQVTTPNTSSFTFSYTVTRHIVTTDNGAVDCAVPHSCQIAVQSIDLDNVIAHAPIEFTAPRVNLRVSNVRLIHPVLPGEPVEVRATVVNAGPEPTSFVVTDAPATGLTDVGVTCAGNGQSPGPGSCAYGPADAPVHQKVATVFTLQVAAGVAGPLVDQVCVHDQNANDVDVHPRNNCKQVTIGIPATP